MHFRTNQSYSKLINLTRIPFNRSHFLRTKKTEWYSRSRHFSMLKYSNLGQFCQKKHIWTKESDTTKVLLEQFVLNDHHEIWERIPDGNFSDSGSHWQYPPIQNPQHFPLHFCRQNTLSKKLSIVNDVVAVTCIQWTPLRLTCSAVARVEGGGNFKLVMIQSSHRFGLAASSPNLSESSLAL